MLALAVVLSIGGKVTYAEQLLDPRWQKKRLEVLQRDDFTCVHCGRSDLPLHVHHKVYQKNTLPWEYEDENYLTLCKLCHDRVETLKKRIGCLISDKELLGDFQSLADHHERAGGQDENVSAYLRNYSNDGSYGPLQ